jgi:hypothetical protein
MSLGESKGGLPPDSVVDSEEKLFCGIVKRLIERYHDPKPGSKLQIVLAPCSPFSVNGELMRESAKLAREYGVHLHTHLAETEDEDDFCLQKFGYKPVAYMQSLDWIGSDVWFCTLRAHKRGGNGPLRAARLRRSALPLLQHAPGIGHRTGYAIAFPGGQTWLGRRRLCQQ